MFLLLIKLFIPLVALAHPVSYEGSYMVASDNSKASSEYMLIYSKKYWLGYGIVAHRFDEDWAYIPQLSILAKRWNLPEAQANIYIYGGYGQLDLENGHTEGITRLGTQIDYETRKVYSAIKVKRFDTLDDYNTDIYTLQAGFAPYIAGFNDLNTWLIGEWTYNPEYQSHAEASLLLRFFYKNVFWELGSNTNGDPMFNFMVHYNP
jgi:hypothetical protein